MRQYYKETEKNIYGRYNIWYIENDILYIWSINNKWENFYGMTITEAKRKREYYFEDILDISQFKEISEKDAFLELL